ncbi:hypothetical protein ABHN11_21595 [Brevibacillus centrosporus]|uniref:hypothetical protein n=1 Tax=Brevibacillus centrosporus TaxID=54910 RepID=UPI0039873D8B
MSEILSDLQKMHDVEPHLIRNSRISIQVLPIGNDSKYCLRPFSIQTEEMDPIPNTIMQDNLKGIIRALTQVTPLPQHKDENTITTFAFDQEGRLQSFEHEIIAGFKNLTQYRNVMTRLLKQLIPDESGMVEVKVGPLGKLAYSGTADFSGSIKLTKFRFATDSEDDQMVIEMNSYVMLSYLPKVMKHGVRYLVHVEEGTLGSPIPVPTMRLYKN